MRLLFLTILFFTSCNSTPKEVQKEKEPVELDTPVKLRGIQNISFRTFTELPKEIDGCACYYSLDSLGFKNKEYIFVDNFEELASINLNGEMIRLTREKTEEFSDFSVKTDYKNDEYQLTIKVFEGESSGDEAWLNYGVITLMTKSGESIKTDFYGECGC